MVLEKMRKILAARTINQILRNLSNAYRGIPLDEKSPLYAVAKALPGLGMDAKIVLLATDKTSNFIRHVILVENGEVKVDKNDFLYGDYKDGIYTYKPVGGCFRRFYPRKKMTKAQFIKESGVTNIGNKYDHPNSEGNHN